MVSPQERLYDKEKTRKRGEHLSYYLCLIDVSDQATRTFRLEKESYEVPWERIQ